ncbi:MAG TPA: nucleotide exchange factor GrpE [Gammaproteobacteria bacterium]|nr:nucleotide exchange factor GrpE [Gammaproteobacteria bacterium]
MNDETKNPGPDGHEGDSAQQVNDAAEAASTSEEGQQDEGASREELLLTLQDARAKADEHWNQLLRVRADFDNYQRRAKRDLENAHKFALESFVRDLLPIVDSLEMGIAAARQQGASADQVREGMELTLKMFQDVLEKFGVKTINPDGEKFNPELHQAMSMQPTPDVEPNTVLTVYQKGYVLNDRLVRPAMVVVSAAPNHPSDGEDGGNGKSSVKIDEIA